MSVLEQVHRKKLLSKIRKVMMDDILTSLIYMVETSNLRVKPDTLSPNVIGLDSYVDGHEGFYTILAVEVIAVKYKDIYVPKVIVIDAETKKGHDIILEDINLTRLLEVYNGTMLGKTKTLTSFIIEKTQSERLDCMEVVRMILDNYSEQYHISGVSNFSKSIL